MTTQEAFFRFDWNRRKWLNPLRMRYTMTREDIKLARILLSIYLAERQKKNVTPD